jgi:hypothetical protein
MARLIAAEFYVHVPDKEEPTATEQWGGLVADVRAAFPDLQVAIGGVAMADGVASATATLTGTFTGFLWGAPPTGRQVTAQLPIRARAAGDRLAINIDLPPPAVVGIFRELDIVNPPDEMDRPQRHPVAWPEFVLQVSWTGQAAPKRCAHLAEARVFQTDVTACDQCVASGDIWPALRMCLVCGTVGCCDTAKNQHMKRHHEQTGHSIFRSLRMAEAWGWCYEDNAFIPTRVLEALRRRA